MSLHLIAPERRLGTPAKAHLNIVWNATCVRPDPRLVRAEGDPDLARTATSFVAGCLAVVKVASMASYE